MNARITPICGTALALGLALAGSARASEALKAPPRLPATAVTNSQVAATNATLVVPLQNLSESSDTRHQFVPPKIQLSGWVAELAKMVQGGIPDEVMLSFINSAGSFNMGADQIIYLHDLGVSSEVITAIMQHDSDIATGRLPMTPPTALSPSSVQTAFVPAQAPVQPNRAEAEQLPSAPLPDEFAASPPPYFFGPAPSEPEPKPELYPVRKPYPVKLLDPIVVYRMEPRPANIQLLYDFP